MKFSKLFFYTPELKRRPVVAEKRGGKNIYPERREKKPSQGQTIRGLLPKEEERER